MELKEPRKKRRLYSEPKSSLPLVFGNKGELTKFHANLTALGSCIADPTEMEIIYKMGYFGKGSLSRSQPIFGRVKNCAPPVIRNRQWKRRQEWITEVQKISLESFFNDDKNDEKKNEEDKGENESVTDSLTHSKELNNTIETIDSTCESETMTNVEPATHQDKSISDIEILDSNEQSAQINGQNNTVNIEFDEVVLDSTEEEDVCEISIDSYQSNNFSKNNLFDKEDEIQITNEYNKDESELQGKLLVLPDSDSDTENYLIDIKPEVKHENFPVRETLHLTFEETFFLMYGLGCLRVIDFDGKYLSIGETWDYFCKEQKHFLQKYIAYHYFRSKGWVVKPGLKYGGDFLLYKEGPPFYHSSYIVIIDVLDGVTFRRIDSKSLRDITWNKFIGLQRLSETVGKEILFAQVLWPPSVPFDAVPTSPDILSQFTVREILWRRWKLNRDISSSNIEDYEDEDDYDSS